MYLPFCKWFLLLCHSGHPPETCISHWGPVFPNPGGNVTKQSRKTKRFNVNNQKGKKKKPTKTKVLIQIIKNAEKTGTNDKMNTYILSPYDLFSRGLGRSTKIRLTVAFLTICFSMVHKGRCNLDRHCPSASVVCATLYRVNWFVSHINKSFSKFSDYILV